MHTAGLSDERFVALYRAHARPLLAFALRRSAQREDAADVVAETMLVAWRRLDDVPAGDAARLWLFGVARHVLANGRRSARRRARLGERLRQDVGRLTAPDVAPEVTAGLTLRGALAVLPEVDREVLQLTAWEGLRPDEIATVLGLSGVAVRGRLYRARARLRDELARDESTVGASQDRATGQVGGDERPLVRKTEDDR